MIFDPNQRPMPASAGDTRNVRCSCGRVLLVWQPGGHAWQVEHRACEQCQHDDAMKRTAAVEAAATIEWALDPLNRPAPQYEGELHVVRLLQSMLREQRRRFNPFHALYAAHSTAIDAIRELELTLKDAADSRQ